MAYKLFLLVNDRTCPGVTSGPLCPSCSRFFIILLGSRTGSSMDIRADRPAVGNKLTETLLRISTLSRGDGRKGNGQGGEKHRKLWHCDGEVKLNEFLERKIMG